MNSLAQFCTLYSMPTCHISVTTRSHPSQDNIKYISLNLYRTDPGRRPVMSADIPVMSADIPVMSADIPGVSVSRHTIGWPSQK